MSEPDEDRLLRIALEELRGGKQPPDLTARILAAAQGESLPLGRTHDARATSNRRARLLGIAAGALLALLVGLGLLPSHPPATLQVAVVEGTLRHAGARAETVLGAGARGALALTVGDRLSAAPRGTTRLDLFDLGMVRLAETTTLEVKNMETTNRNFGGGFAIGALTVAVIGGAVWVYQGSQGVEAKSGDSVELRAGKPAVASLSAEELARLRDREGALTKQLETMQSQVKELEERLARRPVEPTSKPSAEPAVAEAKEPEAPKAARFGYPGLEEALAEIDWKKSGAAIHKMAGMLAELQDALSKGEEIPLDLLGRIQSENGMLIQQAMALVKYGVPGTGINGAYTHPVVVANQLHAALADAKVPLDEKQMAALNRLATQYAGTDDQRRSNLPADALKLRGTLEEIDLKDRFYEEAKNLLTPAQRELFFKPGTGDGLMGSMFSAGLLMAPFVKPMAVESSNEYSQQVAREFGKQLKLDAAGQEKLAVMTSRWVEQMPTEFFQPIPASDGPMGGIPKIGKQQARSYAQHQVALFDQMIQNLQLTPEQQKKLRDETRLALPFVSAKKK